MKLQKNNKYAKMIATMLLTSAILSGCGNAEAVVEPNESEVIEEIVEENINVVEEDIEVHDIVKDQYYYYNYFNITDQERENRLDIKYPNVVHRSNHIKTLLVRDGDVYKVLPVLLIVDDIEKVSTFYDLFTEEKLFDYSYNDISEIEGELDVQYHYYINGYNFSKIQNAIPYFDNKEIVGYGTCLYTQLFLIEHFDEFKEKDGINYQIDIDSIIEYFYDIPFNTGDLMISSYDYADNYVTTVPLENQVTSKELGLKSKYNAEEDKYFDFWKISDEEAEDRLANFEIVVDSKEEMTADSIHTLVFKDSEGNYKLMNIVMFVEDGMVRVSDVYTAIHLFDAPIVSKLNYKIVNENVHYYEGMDLENIVNVIPYFDDKEIVKIDIFNQTNYFVGESINELRKKDGVDYKYPESTYWFYLYPMEECNSAEISYSVEEYAKNYLVTVPQDMQVNSKDLKMNLDKDKVKTLN